MGDIWFCGKKRDSTTEPPSTVDKERINEKKALYIKLYGDSGISHGLWVRRFSGIWEECVQLCG